MAWNDLKQPTKSKNWPETNYNEQETTLNNLQRAKNERKQPTTTWNDLQRAKKILETTYNKQIFRLLYYLGQSHFPLNIWLQSFKHFFMENHNGNRVPSIYILSCAFITDYKICRILCEPLGHFQISICEAKANLMN